MSISGFSPKRLWSVIGRKSVVVGGVVAGVFCLLLGGSPSYALPAFKAVSGTPISSASAGIWYSQQPNNSTHTDQLCALNSSLCSRAEDAEIVELARSLGAGTATTDGFTNNVYEYIYKNIDTEFRYGLSKGAFGALLDQSGTPFDQASLMVELLRQGGVSTNYQAGTVTMSGSDFAAWTNITNPRAACQLLADGGIPINSINGSYYAACSSYSSSSQITSISFSHIWVSANSKLYDPSFKTYAYSTSIDLPGAMQCKSGSNSVCGSDANLAALPSGVSFNSSLNAHYAQNVQFSNLGNTLNNYAKALQQHIQTSIPTASLHDIVGGRKIDDSQLPTPSSSLPYDGSPVSYHTWTDIPDPYRSSITVSMDNLSTELFADELNAYSVELYATYGTDGSGNETRTVVLRLTDPQINRTTLSTSSNYLTTSQSGTVSIAANHPYAASSGTYMDDVYQQTENIGMVQIIQAWGRTGPGRSQWWQKVAAQRNPVYVAAFNTTDPWFAPYPVAWLAQAGIASSIADGILSTQTTEQHTIGSAYNGTSDPFVDLQLSAFTAVSVSSPTNDTNDQLAATATDAASYAGLEGSVMEQQFDSPDGGSVPSWFQLTNQPSPWSDGTTNNDGPATFYEVTPTNVSAVLAVTSHYSAGDKTFIQSYLSSGSPTFNAILPSNGRVGDFHNGTTLTYTATGFVAYSTDTSGSQQAYVTTLGAKGAGAVEELDPAKQAEQSAKTRPTKPLTFDVNLARGDVSLAPEPDLVTGAGKFPYSLPFLRYYNSGKIDTPLCAINSSIGTVYFPVCAFRIGELPLGWSHNWEISAERVNDGFRGLGADSGVEASAAIAAIYTIADLSKSSTFSNHLTTVFAEKWFTDQLSDNAVTVTQPPAIDTYVRLPDGSYAAPPGKYGTIVLTGPRERDLLAAGLKWQYPTDTTMTLTEADGSVLNFDNSHEGSSDYRVSDYRGLFPVSWVFPSGVKITFAYTSWTNSQNFADPYNGKYVLSSVSNSLGRSLSFSADSNGSSDADGYNSIYDFKVADENSRTVTVRFKPVSGADPNANSNTYSLYDAMKVTSPLGRASIFTFNKVSAVADYPDARLSSIYLPADHTHSYLSFGWDSMRRAKTSTDGDGNVTTYYPAQVSTEQSARAAWKDAMSPANVWTAYYDDKGHETLSTDPLGNATSKTYDGLGRLNGITYPEGNQELYTYDVRSNRLSTTRVPKPGSNLANITSSTSFNEGSSVVACTHPANCNEPLTSTDGRAHTTNYTFSSTTGLLGQVKLPADADGVRPQTDYSYNSYSMSDGQTVYLLHQKTKKKTSTVSVSTTYAYDSGNKYVLQTATLDPGSSPHLNRITTYTFNSIGDLTAINGPRTDVTDINYFTWDNDRNLIFAIQPAVNGTHRPTVKTTYNSNGQPQYVDRGYATSSTGSGFVSSLQTSYLYDYAAHKTKETTPTRVTQFSYDADGRPSCTAVRLDLTVSIPSSACTLSSASAHGQDQITKIVYDAAGRKYQELRGVGTSLQEAYATYSYTNNGRVASVYDALGTSHTTTYDYDDLDRLKTTTYPDSTTDQITSYDDNDNILGRTNRAGQSFTYTYDNLDRMLSKGVPAYGSVSARTLLYSYDLLNNELQVGDGSQSVDNTYDAASEKLSETRTVPGLSGSQQITYGYDNEGNRNSLEWPDAYTVSYHYNALNLPDTVTNGSNTLASYTYTDLGQQHTLQYAGTGALVTYDWSAEDLLNSLTNDLSGSADDVAYSFTYTPAHQTETASIDNAAFRFTPAASGTDSYGTVNSLNQYPTVNTAGNGSATLSYDANGNLTGDGTWTFGYDPENRLVSADNGTVQAAYLYDPLGRRVEKSGTGVTTTFFLDAGDDEIAEYDGSGTLLRRYIPGSALDRPIAMVSVSGGASTSTYFHFDKLGSVVAMSDSVGALTEGPYPYDSYGNGAPGTGVPFKFTGRRLDVETGLYYYRARYYSANLGRFMQTDPVGYNADVNLYTYVGNDPTDRTDPSGRFTVGLGVNITGAIPLEAVGCDPCGGTGEVGVAVSFPVPFLDPSAQFDAGVYGTGGAAHGLGVMGGPTVNAASGSVSDLSTHGKVDTQGVIAVGPVGVAVDLEGNTSGSFDPKAIKGVRNITPKQIIKTVKSILGGHKKIGDKGVGGFIGVTQTKTVTYTVRDLVDWLSGK